MKIFVIRHGETDMNKARKIQGQTEDAELNATGLAQAQASIAVLPTGLTICFASPLKRARQTAEIITKHFKIPIVFRDELKEKHYGSLSGKLWDEVVKIVEKDLTRVNTEADLSPYGGESVEDVKNRLNRFFEELRNQYSHEVPLVVTHGGGHAIYPSHAQRPRDYGNRQRIGA
jgi:probable phosphoglycerate mutase